MARYLTAAAVGCLYVALACWVVRGEGRAYRDALRQARLAARAEVPTPPVTVPELAAATPKAETGPDVPARTPVVSAPAPAPAAPAPAPAPVRPAPARSVDVPPPQAPAVISPWANALDLNRMTTEEERRLGRELRQLILAANPPLNQGDWLQRVESAAGPILETRARKDLDYEFTVLDSNAVSAFSTPGGYVYVCRGLFDLIGTDEESKLVFVLGHEIAHVDLKHAIRTVAANNAKAKAGGIETLKQFLVPIALAYPDAQEYEADAWVAGRMLSPQLDHSRRMTLAFLRAFKGYAEANGFPNGHTPPDEKAGAGFVENHFRAHPAAYRRLSKLSPQVKPPGPPSTPTR